jgi:hypothetical protein
VKHDVLVFLEPYFGHVQCRPQQGTAEPLANLIGGHGYLGDHIQANGTVRAGASAIDDRCRVGIQHRVPLRQAWFRSARPEHTAHQNQAAQQRWNLKIDGKEESHIRQGANRQQRHLAQVGPSGLTHKLNCRATRKVAIVLPVGQG